MGQPAKKTLTPSYLVPGGKKARARGISSAAIAAGKIVRELCEEQVDDGHGGMQRCNSGPTDAHHDDYDEPLGVRWLCKTHHRRAHPNVKPVAFSIKAMSRVSQRRFRDNLAAWGEPMIVMRYDRATGDRRTAGIWYPVWMIDEESDRG
jgi:hypothetical protein